jgi:hypothetical protein
MENFSERKEFSSATGLHSMYYNNEASIASVQDNKSSQAYRSDSMYCTVKGYLITVTHTEDEDWEYYSKAWHRSHGPKRTITGRFVNFYKKGEKQRSIAVNSFAGNYAFNAIIEQFSVKKEVAGITLKKKTGKHFKKIQLNDRLKVKYEGKRGIVKFFSRWLLDARIDFCALDKEGNTFHGPTKLDAIKGLKKKLEAAAEFDTEIINYSTAKDLGFCQSGIITFCEINDIDINGDFTRKQLEEIIRKSATENCQKFAAEIKKLGIQVC